MNIATICADETTPWTSLAPGIEMQIYHAGDFEPVTYGHEPKDAVHNPVHTKNDIL